ncbi:unnamed protein product, partial [Fusarium langsethiae]
WTSFSDEILKTLDVPLNINKTGNGASTTNPFPKKEGLRVKSVPKKIAYLGHHYFNADGVPTFDLDEAHQILRGKKIDSVKAPPPFLAGPDGTDSVDWLFLGDAGGSHGVSYVYRVLTAGGSSRGCKTKGTDYASYTAMYWFYA